MVFGPFVVLAGATVALVCATGWTLVAGALAAVIVASAFGPGYRPAWRLARHVHSFRTAADRKVAVPFPPGCGESEAQGVLGLCRQELDSLAARFGSPLWGRVGVYLIANGRDLEHLRGLRVGGFA